MFQRQNKFRQAGFIRCHDFSKQNSVELCCQGNDRGSEGSFQFSPFRDESPASIRKILETHRPLIHRNQVLIEQFNQRVDYDTHRDKKDKRLKERKHANSHFDITNEPRNQKKAAPRLQKQIDQLQQVSEIFHKYQTTYEVKQKNAIIITETVEEVRQIECMPEQLNLSLAQSFNLYCGKIKQKLEGQRMKFSKSKKNRSNQLAISVDKISKLSKKSTFQSFDRPQKRYQSKEMVKGFPSQLQHRNSDGDTKRKPYWANYQNKQNCEEYANTKHKEMKTPRPSIEIKQTKFFIPAPTSRSKPITPRQAYQHSLKKWKQLPEVVAREKEKQKEAQLRERLSKMKAHSIEVRRSLKK